MRVPSRQPALSLAVVFALVLILLALAALQIHWTEQVSQADRERLRANLDTAVTRFQRDFYLQLLRICWAFRMPETQSETAAMAAYADRYDDWMNASAYPAIIAGLFVWDARQARLFRLNQATEQFEPAPWPPELLTLKRHLREVMSASSPEGRPGPHWILDEETYALIHPFQISSGRRRAGSIIVQLSPSFLWHRLAPELTRRYFGAPATSRYAVAVISRNHPVKTLYESTAAASGRPLASGDIVASLVPRRDGGIGGGPASAAGDPVTGGIELGAGRRYFPIARFATAGQQWELVVRGTSGSVEAAVRALHRRNLIVSFGVLLLLAIAMSLVIISAQAAHRLARAQMTFLAGVSHELRTPLTVICSAADNLADGTLTGLDQVKDYGNLIRGQGRRLSQMVNAILSFASGQSGRRVYRREPLDIAGVVEAALANLQAEIQSQRVTVEKSIDKELPLVMGDPSALTECVQNLVSNAIRYGGEARWVSIRVGRQHFRRREAVAVTVEDRGPGISPRDLPRIFEPFYRGTNATEAQIHGTGLGLSLAREVAKAMDGRLAVRSTIGKGSQFTLSLTAARP